MLTPCPAPQFKPPPDPVIATKKSQIEIAPDQGRSLDNRTTMQQDIIVRSYPRQVARNTMGPLKRLGMHG